MVNNTNLLSQVEHDIAFLLIDKLVDHTITLERASHIAKFVLAHLPKDLSDEQVINILPSLDDEFIELATIVHRYMSVYEEKYSKIVIAQMSDLIKHKHFEKADKMATEYFKRKFM